MLEFGLHKWAAAPLAFSPSFATGRWKGVSFIDMLSYDHRPVARERCYLFLLNNLVIVLRIMKAGIQIEAAIKSYDAASWSLPHHETMIIL